MTERVRRIARWDVQAISTKTKIHERSEGQYFCETPKAWELVQIHPPMKLKRWDKKRVYWVIPRKERGNA